MSESAVLPLLLTFFHYQVFLILMIIGMSIRGQIASTSLPECFAYSGSKFRTRLSLMIDRSLLQKNPDQASAGSPFLRYSFLASTHPVHPPSIHFAWTTEAPGGFPEEASLDLQTH
ncbi:hypothetical protein CRENBAI_006702 [Crenichthys baileyi]|uniref:Uncharacterized protein n=1 Tax=Crenichthys baileyi TaxID=28760 RepID=A0AAV9QY58_9TELE